MSHKDEQIVKVEGWVERCDDFPGQINAVDPIEIHRASFLDVTRPCTLLIAPEGSTQVPRYFSEGDVRAFLREVIGQEDLIPGDDNHYPFQAVASDDIKAIAVKHGLTL